MQMWDQGILTSCSQAMRTASQEPSAAVLPAVPPELGSQKLALSLTCTLSSGSGRWSSGSALLSSCTATCAT